MVKTPYYFFIFVAFFLQAMPSLAEIMPLPQKIPTPHSDGVIYYKNKALNLNPLLQQQLQQYLQANGNPISALMLVEVDSGNILSLIQGQPPTMWHNNKNHTAVYSDFPAASIFKTITTIAALETIKLSPHKQFGLFSGCGSVNPRATWLRTIKPTKNRQMSLQNAFANSCNNFYAMLSIEWLGLGSLIHYANKLGWQQKIIADFIIPLSPINIPQATTIGIHTVGRIAAGFGRVGMSVAHAAWLYLAIAQNGLNMPLKIFANSKLPKETQPKKLFSTTTSKQLLKMMNKTVTIGTAANIFSARRYHRLRKLAGGKTGTLMSTHPKRLATWFVGLMPYKKPQVVVSAIVLNKPKWVIKGTHLAAEALLLWYNYNKLHKKIIAKKTSLPLSH